MPEESLRRATGFAALAPAPDAVDPATAKRRLTEAELERGLSHERFSVDVPVCAGTGKTQWVVGRSRVLSLPERSGTAGLACQLNEANAVVAVQRSVSDVCVGDVVIGVGTSPLRGRSASDELPALTPGKISLRLRMARAWDLAKLRLNAEGLPAGDYAGWLTTAEAVGGAATTKLRQKWCALVGDQLCQFDVGEGGDFKLSDHQKLSGVLCKTPLKLVGADHSPIFRQFQENGLFPFKLAWPAGEVEHELVCGAGSEAERKGWVKAVSSVQRLIGGSVAPTSGWLHMKGKGKLWGETWNRSWFVLTPGIEGGYPEFKYYTESFDTEPKGQILLDQDVEITRDKGHCFSVICPSTDGTAAVTHSFRAASAEELDRWLREVANAFEMTDLPKMRNHSSICSSSSNSFTASFTSRSSVLTSGGSISRSSVCAGSSPKTSFSLVPETEKGADKVQKWSELERPELLKLQIKQLKLVLEHLGAIVPDTDAELKELKRKCKGTVTTRKEMEDEVKTDLVDQIVSARAQAIAGQRSAMPLGGRRKMSGVL